MGKSIGLVNYFETAESKKLFGYGIDYQVFKEERTGKKWVFLYDVGLVVEIFGDYSGALFFALPFTTEEGWFKMGYIARSPFGTIGRLVFSTSKQDFLYQIRPFLGKYYQPPAFLEKHPREDVIDGIISTIEELI